MLWFSLRLITGVMWGSLLHKAECNQSISSFHVFRGKLSELTELTMLLVWIFEGSCFLSSVLLAKMPGENETWIYAMISWPVSYFMDVCVGDTASWSLGGLVNGILLPWAFQSHQGEAALIEDEIWNNELWLSSAFHFKRTLWSYSMRSFA